MFAGFQPNLRNYCRPPTDEDGNFKDPRELRQDQLAKAKDIKDDHGQRSYPPGTKFR